MGWLILVLLLWPLNWLLATLGFSCNRVARILKLEEQTDFGIFTDLLTDPIAIGIKLSLLVRGLVIFLIEKVALKIMDVVDFLSKKGYWK